MTEKQKNEFGRHFSLDDWVWLCRKSEFLDALENLSPGEAAEVAIKLLNERGGGSVNTALLNDALGHLNNARQILLGDDNTNQRALGLLREAAEIIQNEVEREQQKEAK